VGSHIAYFRHRPQTQPPWFVAAIATAGERLGGVDNDAVWGHRLVTESVSGWLILRRLIGTSNRKVDPVSRTGTFRLTSSALAERLLPLFGNPDSPEQYISHVRRRLANFNGERAANIQYWRGSLMGVLQPEQLTPAFIEQVFLGSPLATGEAYGVVVYSRFVREAEARQSALISADAVPASWNDDAPDDRFVAPPPPSAVVQPPPPSSSSRRSGRSYPMAPPPPPSTTSSTPSRTQLPTASSSGSTTPSPADAGPSSSYQGPGHADWARHPTPLGGPDSGYNNPPSSTFGRPTGSLGGPFARYRPSSYAPSTEAEESTIWGDEDDTGAFEGYNPVHPPMPFDGEYTSLEPPPDNEFDYRY
jgi:hypothetical protein